MSLAENFRSRHAHAAMRVTSFRKLQIKVSVLVFMAKRTHSAREKYRSCWKKIFFENLGL